MYVGTKEIKKVVKPCPEVKYVIASPPSDEFVNKISRLVAMHWSCSKNTQFKLTVKKFDHFYFHFISKNVQFWLEQNCSY